MDASHSFLIEDGIAIERYGGHLTTEFVAEAMRKVATSLSISSSTPMLVDLSGCSLATDLLCGNELVTSHDSLHSGGRTAILVDTPQSTALAVLFASRIKARTVRVFSTETAARRWLRL